MNFKQDANSLPNLSKENRIYLDMNAETIGVILVKTCILGMMPGKRRKRKTDRRYDGIA